MTDSPLDRLLEQGVDFETIGKRLECGISISEQEAAHRAPLEGFYELCDLTDEERQPPEFIVDGLLPVGLTFLSGAPKIRKSFLALQLAAAVATGSDFLGRKTRQCNVAYFDLEGSKSRVSARAERMSIAIPRGVFFANQVDEKLADGELVDQIRAIHRFRPEIRLAIIDTYSRARGSFRSGGANAYDSDVMLLEPLQRMAQEEKIAVLCVHHDRKGAGLVTDTFERLSGTMGISGSADSVLNLIAEGKRFDGRAKLEFNPRDAKGGEMLLTFDESCLEWRVVERSADNIRQNQVAAWCIDHAPEKNAAGDFVSYESVYRAIFRHNAENSGTVIREQIVAARSELFESCGVGVQVGVKSHGERGIRLFRVF